MRDLPELLEVKPKAVFAALRLGMSGQSVTPGLFESLWALGRDEAVARLEQAAASSAQRLRSRLPGAWMPCARVPAPEAG